jgi:hypothetical protein
LIASHAKLACIDCHVDDSPQIAIAKCTTCHAALAARMATGTGLHAQVPVRMQACNECHHDHRGARYEARWSAFGSPDRFDHALTGWPLGKGHRVGCERCHPAAAGTASSRESSSSQFVGASRQCADCHASPHAGTAFASRDCGTCHLAAFESFKTVSFDHDAAWPIGASHRTVACTSCHTPQRGAATPPHACASCHASRDPHDGRFAAFGTPPACEKCHSPTMSFTPGQTPPVWKPNNFDHARDGKWQLAGKHSELACRACHRLPNTTTFAPLNQGKDCLGCHEHRRVHDHKYSNVQCLHCHVSPGAVMIHEAATPAP